LALHVELLAPGVGRETKAERYLMVSYKHENMAMVKDIEILTAM
jgi:hypothetical protein